MPYQDILPVTANTLSGFERVKTDAIRTSFLEGREFRIYKELNIAPGATYVIKTTVPVDTVLFGLEVGIESGHLRLGTYVFGTEGGTFSETLPVFNVNIMERTDNRRRNSKGWLYENQVTLTAGGTHTGGFELDVIRLKAANTTAQSQSVGNAPQDERGASPGVYYFRLLNLSNNDAITGVLRARWEERPLGFFLT